MEKGNPSEHKAGGSKKMSYIASGTELEVLALVNDMTQKILLKQPENIYLFCAEWLEGQLEKREAKRRKEARKAQRREKTARKMYEQSEMAKLTLGVSSGMQENDPLREQVTVVTVGARGPPVPAFPVDYTAPPHVTSLEGHTAAVTQCCFLSDHVITSSADCSLRVWRKDTGEQVLKLGCEKPIHNFVLTTQKDKHVLFAACGDGSVMAWRLKLAGSDIKARCSSTMPCHQPNPIRAIAASPNGKLLATGCCFYMHQIALNGMRRSEISVRGTLKVWNLTDMLDWALHPKRHYHDITQDAMKTMKQLVINSHGGQLNRRAGLGDSHYGIRALAFTPDSKVLAVGFGTPEGGNVQDIRMVALCEAETLETLWVQEEMDYQTNGLMFSNTGSGSFQAPWELFIASQQGIGKVSLFLSGDSHQRLRLRELWKKQFEGYHCGLCVAPNARQVASALGGALHIRDSVSGQNIGAYPGHAQSVTQLAFSKDGRMICTVSSDHTAKLWKFGSGTRADETVVDMEESLTTKNVIPPIGNSPNSSAIACQLKLRLN